MAAVLACGEGAVLSHRSAGALWQLLNHDGIPDVTTRTHRRVPGVRTHESAHTADVTIHRRIPVTTPARTLADLAHTLTPQDLTRAVREAEFKRLFHLPSMLAVLDHRPSKQLSQLLADLNPTQSHLEDRLLTLCAQQGLPTPRAQQHVQGRRVDFLWPQHHLIVETDGYEAHATPHAFQHDRTTTNQLQLAGYTTLRFTHADLTHRPAHVVQQIAHALGMKGSRA